MSKETGGSMYPGKVFSHFRSNADCNGSEAVYMDSEGLTIRDYFAGQALPALIEKFTSNYDYKYAVQHAYGIADLMLEERSNR